MSFSVNWLTIASEAFMTILANMYPRDPVI